MRDAPGLGRRSAMPAGQMIDTGGDRGRKRAWTHAVLTWVIARRLVLGVGLIVAVPVLVSTVRALVAGWTPVWDDAIIATRSYDVLSSHSPLVGEHSDASLAHMGQVFSPGPLLNWLFALPTHVAGDWALPVTMGVLNTAAIIGVVALARRRGGTTLMFMTAIAVAVMFRSLPQEVLHQPDNSKALYLVFALLLFLAWSVGCGEYRLLPLTVLVASLLVQAHLSYGLGTLMALAIALGGMTWFLTRSRGSGTANAEHPRRWLFAALGVGAVCWAAPLVDLAIHPPGNLVRLVQNASAHQRTFGLSPAWHALVRTVGIPPWWLRDPVSAAGRFFDLARSPGAGAIASAIVILGGISVVAVVGIRRRRLDLVVAAALALALNAAVVIYTASTPLRLGFSLDYGLRWTSPAGMFMWLVLGWSLVTLMRPARSPSARSLRTPPLRRPVAGIAALSITTIAAILVTVGAGSDFFQWSYRPVRTITSQVLARLPHPGPVLVDAASLSGFNVQQALVYQLRRAGYRVLVPTGFGIAEKFGAYYSHGPQPRIMLFVGDSNTPPPPGARQIARVSLHHPPFWIALGKPPPTAITVSVLS